MVGLWVMALVYGDEWLVYGGDGLWLVMGDLLIPSLGELEPKT
jgi:hypothetical protein